MAPASGTLAPSAQPDPSSTAAAAQHDDPPATSGQPAAYQLKEGDTVRNFKHLEYGIGFLVQHANKVCKDAWYVSWPGRQVCRYHAHLAEHLQLVMTHSPLPPSLGSRCSATVTGHVLAR